MGASGGAQALSKVSSSRLAVVNIAFFMWVPSFVFALFYVRRRMGGKCSVGEGGLKQNSLSPLNL